MKKNKLLSLSLLTSSLLTVMGCSNVKSGNKDNIIFNSKNIVLNNFEGLGVEWGTYEDPDKISTAAWERSLNIMDRLNPSCARVMLNYDWFVENFDNKGNDDKTDDTWTYNFANKYMNNTIKILQYCDDHDIDVAFGCWNVVGSLTNDIYGMMEEVTSDIRWAKMTGDIIEYLVRNQGIRSIKYFVNSNEPNYTGSQGMSKNYNNTYEKWAQGVKNVRAELDKRGFTNIGIVGGDTTGVEGTKLYLGNIAKDKEMKKAVGDYGFHIYSSNYLIDQGTLMGEIANIYNQIKASDPELGVVRQPHIWESGLLDGKNNETDSNAYITLFSYGLRMADYTLQCLLAGVNSICYWDFDDAMHYMYAADGSTNTKGWGMFSSLTTDSAIKQEIRPWFHSSTLLTNLLCKGSRVIDSTFNSPEIDSTFRSMAVLGKENEFGGVVAVNRGIKPVTKSFRISDEIKNNDKVYVYFYNEKDLRLNQEGYVIANEVLDASLNDEISLEIPASSLVVLSSKEL